MEALVAKQQYSPTEGEVLTPTDARQASPRKMNLRVLVISTALIVAIFAAFVIAFLYQTPSSMDGNSDNTGATSAPVNPAPPQGQTAP
jgi:hypothetical protein